MHNSKTRLVEHALTYKPIIEEYCQLSLRPILDDSAANRIAEILYQAEAEPLLGLLLDEADHLVAHYQDAIHDQQIANQQQKLRATIESLWMEWLMQDMEARSSLVKN
jgi:hypothetical protein